jgi:hypothetical protein
MIEMAIVGLGSLGLCVMERTVSRARRVGTPVPSHGFEPAMWLTRVRTNPGRTVD